MELKDILQLVNQIVNNYTDATSIGIDDILVENGFDSISIVDLIVGIENAFEIEFDNSKISYNSLKSIRAISETIFELINNKKDENIENLNQDLVTPWWSKIPISVNSAFGDALTSSQIDDTCMKLNFLKQHNAAYGFCTKAVPDQKILEKLQQVPITSNLSIRYSLTGLDEGGYSFEERLNAIKELKSIFGKVIIITRPLIYGRNTSKDNLLRLVKAASETSGLLITGGLHDKTKRKQIDIDVRQQLTDLCKEYGVKYFHKSSCASAYITGKKCWVHNLHKPINVSVLDDLGYEYVIKDNRIILKYGTVGDLNFLRMITGSYVLCNQLTSGYNLLSFSDKNCIFDVTSSWYSWSQNRRCQLNCDYCIIREIEYLENDSQIGVRPDEIENYAKNSKRDFIDANWKKGRYSLIDDGARCVGYNNVRTIQDCLTETYK